MYLSDLKSNSLLLEVHGQPNPAPGVKCITEGKIIFQKLISRGGGGLRLLDTREYTHTSIREHGLQVACIDGSTVVHANWRTVVDVRINRSTYARMKVW